MSRCNESLAVGENDRYRNIDKMVNHPTHYHSKNGVECIQCIEAAVENLTGMDAVDTANAIKYLFRWSKKDGIQDIKKALWYVSHLLQRLEKEELDYTE